MNTKAKQEKWVIKLDSVGMHHGIGPEGKPFVAKTCGSTSNSYDTATLIVRACNAHDDLVAALETWERFFDEMPKGQFGKISCNIGLMNDGFIKMRTTLAKAKG